ncbi:MAG: hypothetical protein P5681_03005 [Limnospira sp. PMC 894.15]|uniref:Uncharacterized protein n=1 Tax=Limnospira fusiformis PMC 851.14 TaxID=2219512 RepID=A0ABU9EIW3_LIMFS|nr:MULTISPECIES: hypothetical protein [unclassified Limnospira]MDT9186772.1 hypothetical protein [Limnospira sp. PMC 894.15]MDT9273742.1 hypothetical protein [Limnospira sp. PMC 737.11]
MMPTSENERIVRAFLLLLHRESKKPESAIIPPTAWETLEELKANLASANDDIKTIARAIAKWCKNHQYSEILQALRPVRGDAIDEYEDPDDVATEEEIKLTNLSTRFVQETIDKSQQQHQQQSS